jgi:hypothetical protein
MKKDKLIITVSGKAMSGKSRLTFLLKNFLREQGYQVEFDGGLDYPTESQFDKHINNNFEAVIENIKESKIIILEEKLLSRDFIEN